MPTLAAVPKAKKKEDGSGWERNNAKAKSGLNKSFNDAGLGQLLEMIEAKSKAAGREFERVPPHFTSQDCPRCHHREKKALSQRTHRCTNCAFVAPRDIASSICIKAKASFARRYPTLMGDFKPLKKVQSALVQEEFTKVKSGCDAATISPFGATNSRAEDRVSDLKPQKKKATKQMLQRLQGVLPLGNCRAPDKARDTSISTRKRSKKTFNSSSAAQKAFQTQLQLDI